VDSATGRGNDLRRFEGSDSSGHHELSYVTRKSTESVLNTGRDDQGGLRWCLAKTGKRVAKIGQTAVKMKNPMVATWAITGMRRVGDCELRASSNALGLLSF
jgi:hypothetical protein